METLSFISTCLMICALSLQSTVPVSDATGTIGVNYGRIADNLPLPSQVVQLLKDKRITRVKIFDTDSAVLSALTGSGISATVCLPNQNLRAAADSQSYTDTWVQANIVPYSSSIDSIAIGNEVFEDPAGNAGYLVDAMQNMQASLQQSGLGTKIKVSSPLSLSSLETSYPPSAGSFKSERAESIIKPMLQFLQQTGSYFMVNVYPYFAYMSDPTNIPLGYALGDKDTAGNTDSGNGLVYHSLFDAQVDAVYSAMSKLGFDDVRVVVAESGWPSMGDAAESAASLANAAKYNGNLVTKVLSGPGTPLKPSNPLDVYIFALFNENLKPGAGSEKNYGLFYPDMKPVYDVPLNPGGSGSTGGDSWCVASALVGDAKLQAGLDWACSQGGADCGPIQSGGSCFEPNTLVAHASYAFNSYYQIKARAPGTCDFSGAGVVVTEPPKFGSCVFPSS